MSQIPQNFYHTMLGLPAAVSAPGHYELLGLDRFEDNVERIRTAAIDRNRQLLSWQNSEFHREADRLMNEVVAAREVLFDPQRKAVYDRQLGRITAATPVATPTLRTTRPAAALASSPPVPILEETTPPPIPAALRPPMEQSTTLPRLPGVKLGSLGPRMFWVLTALAACLLLAIVGGGTMVVLSNRGVPVPQAPRPAPLSKRAATSASQGALPTSLVVPFTGTKAGDRQELTGAKTGFRWCPPGSFTMGSPASETGHRPSEDQVQVMLSRGFWLQETEVTQGEWQELMGTTPWKGQTSLREGVSYPATYVSHSGDGDSAENYCVKLTARERAARQLPTDWEYRLPTEAEWEYACRAGTRTRFSFGDDETQLSHYGWWGGIVGDSNAKTEQYAHRVGLKKANAWGLCDMHGNVWEWCQDSYVDKLAGGTDPLVTSRPSYRVNRGGCWFCTPAFCRSAYRFWDSPVYRGDYLGFRPLAVLSR